MKKVTPDYKRIYSDIISKKYPSRKLDCTDLLEKSDLSVLDIIELNRKIFGSKSQQFNQKHRSYKQSDILEILNYQKKHMINNTQLAKHFKISRNTIAKWKKLF
ncbi:MAG: uncharacterized protein K0R77_3235 [Chryseobacterium sp.]|jgi:hypothetical protein|uniref:HTH domain-containing protein n=1 Tax=Chryseobacterium sp. TaxID=1871047 RepID=UPI0026303C4E|nr:HTH domain-containing protein [Chryseobacterium sp.]MDF2553960.1 uncharacterized protein [Chryseobacterium sp.]